MQRILAVQLRAQVDVRTAQQLRQGAHVPAPCREQQRAPPISGARVWVEHELVREVACRWLRGCTTGEAQQAPKHPRMSGFRGEMQREIAVVVVYHRVASRVIEQRGYDRFVPALRSEMQGR